MSLLKACPHCDSTAGVYREVTFRQVYHVNYWGQVVRPVDGPRTKILHATKTVRCIACNRRFRWKPPTLAAP